MRAIQIWVWLCMTLTACDPTSLLLVGDEGLREDVGEPDHHQQDDAAAQDNAAETGHDETDGGDPGAEDIDEARHDGGEGDAYDVEEGVDDAEAPHEDAVDGDAVHDAGDTWLDVPCPPGDLCGPGEYIDRRTGRCSSAWCRDPCANSCEGHPWGDYCGCSDIGPGCGPLGRGCVCYTDHDCQWLTREGLCGGFRCNTNTAPLSFFCYLDSPVTCPAGEVCDPETGACRPE